MAEPSSEYPADLFARDDAETRARKIEAVRQELIDAGESPEDIAG